MAVLHHTWTGGLLVHLFLISCWVLGGIFVAVTCAGMAYYTYGLSFFIFGATALARESRKQRVWVIVCLALYVYLGPRSREAAGFLRYWCCLAWLACMAYATWFHRFAARPGFVKLVQDLDAAKYYKGVSGVQGSLEDIRKEGSLFAFHPHGILAGGFTLNACFHKDFRELAGADTQFLCDKVLRDDNPFFKVMSDVHGGIDTLDKNNLLRLLAAKRNVAFVPGGFEDATVMIFGKHRTCMRKRAGFIKYALMHGCRVHPVYTFGESETYHTYTGFLKFRLWLNKFGIPAVVFFGYPLLPLLPRTESKLSTYVGSAIEMPRIASPSTADVEKWHTIYCEKLAELFEKHKKAEGLSNLDKLEIL
mmetsp:Transcript_59396/g.173775  ORF Transcript_59396/g.173775 Transcript_59396/m.173775 type:complete len:363 (+) Transcript_59396:55-1143(+)